MRDLVHRRTPVVAGVVEPLDRDAAVDLILPVVARLADADRARVGGEPIPVAVVARGPLGAEDHREASALAERQRVEVDMPDRRPRLVVDADIAGTDADMPEQGRHARAPQAKEPAAIDEPGPGPTEGVGGG